MALMLNNPLMGVSQSVGHSQGKPPSGGGGRSWDLLPSSAQSVPRYSSAGSDSNLMQLFADARYNSEQYNSAEAEKNRRWQEYMSNTAHQREVQDLLAAGLNPVLSVTGGNGASTPAGSEAQLADNSASIMSFMGAMMSAGAVVGAAAINAKSAMDVAQWNSSNKIEGVIAQAISEGLKSGAIQEALVEYVPGLKKK